VQHGLRYLLSSNDYDSCNRSTANLLHNDFLLVIKASSVPVPGSENGMASCCYLQHYLLLTPCSSHAIVENRNHLCTPTFIQRILILSFVHILRIKHCAKILVPSGFWPVFFVRRPVVILVYVNGKGRVPIQSEEVGAHIYTHVGASC
jgi:hypothetical protein